MKKIIVLVAAVSLAIGSPVLAGTHKAKKVQKESTCCNGGSCCKQGSSCCK